MIHTDGRRTVANAPRRPAINPNPPAKAHKPTHGGYPGEPMSAERREREWGAIVAFLTGGDDAAS